MGEPIAPFLLFFCGGLLAWALPPKARRILLVLVPVVGLWNLSGLGSGAHWHVSFMDYTLTMMRVDKLSLIFGYIFHIAAFIGFIYAFHLDDRVEQIAIMIHVGSALGIVFAGDLVTLFIFWEVLSIASVFIIWARRRPEATRAGFRYLLVHAAGGLFLLGGIVLRASEVGSIDFVHMELADLATFLIFMGFGINCAWPGLHAWLTDAYPESTVTGTVFLSAFTTKAAVYALARGFAGTSALIWVGALMTAFPIFYAVIENDLRRVLSYSLINQVGFMVCGIGIGTPLALNGAISHAFNDILFKALLFMAMGAVMYRTGRIHATDLGGLYRTMPLTCVFCMVGAASISAFPLFSAFVSKSMVMEAAALGNMRIVWFILLFASAGVFHHAGIKIPYFAFFSHDSGLRPKEAPLHMLIAMGIAAFLCVFIGCAPGYLYSLLPYEVGYVPYTWPHVLGQSQLLFFSSLAFTLLILSGIYPAEMRAVNLDADWFYRKGALALYRGAQITIGAVGWLSSKVVVGGLVRGLASYLREGPAKTTIALLYPAWLVEGTGGNEIGERKKRVRLAMEKGAGPVGIGAAAAIFLLLLLFLAS
jgi:multicomponent Na+:H+ antiporter subunit D